MAGSDLSLTVPRYTNGRAYDLNGLQEIIHVSRLSFFTHSCTRSFFVSSLKERNYTYSMYLSTVKGGSMGKRGRSRVGCLVVLTLVSCTLPTPWRQRYLEEGRGHLTQDEVSQ